MAIPLYPMGELCRWHVPMEKTVGMFFSTGINCYDMEKYNIVITTIYGKLAIDGFACFISILNRQFLTIILENIVFSI